MLVDTYWIVEYRKENASDRGLKDVSDNSTINNILASGIAKKQSHL